MNNLRDTQEKITNLAVIVAFLIFLAGFIFRAYRSHQSRGLQVGETLPELTGYDWRANQQSLVLVLQKGCHFCEESMPFYRTLYGLEKEGHLSATMVAVFPDDPYEVNRLLRDESLPLPAISRINISSVKATGTPTLILVDRNRKVQQIWVGELDAARRDSVLKLLTVQTNGRLEGTCVQTKAGHNDDTESWSATIHGTDARLFRQLIRLGIRCPNIMMSS